MTIDQARKWIISSSIFITGAQLVFLLVAPAINYPLTYPKNLELLQIITPVFLGYLGAAAHFVFQNPAPPVPVQNQFLGMLVRGPFIVYGLAVVAALAAFGFTNRVGVAMGGGMSTANLATALSIALGILAATTSILSSYLFVAPHLTPPVQSPPVA